MARDTAGDADAVAGSAAASFGQFASRERLQVLRALQAGERRLSSLQRSTGASADTLSETLADLEALDFVESRTAEADLLDTDYRCSQEVTGTIPDVGRGPVETYYALTPRGAALEPVFEAVEDWADDWFDDQSDELGAPDR